MEVTVSIPDKFVPPSDLGTGVSLHVLEAYAIEKYRQLQMSLGQLAELLDLSIDGANAFLKEHKVPQNCDLDDLIEDRKAMERFLAR